MTSLSLGQLQLSFDDCCLHSFILLEGDVGFGGDGQEVLHAAHDALRHWSNVGVGDVNKLAVALPLHVFGYGVIEGIVACPRFFRLGRLIHEKTTVRTVM